MVQTQGSAIRPKGGNGCFQTGTASEKSQRRNDGFTFARFKDNGKAEYRRISTVVWQGAGLRQRPRHDGAIEIHKTNANIHEALHSLSHSDEAVNNKFIALEDEITLTISDKLKSLGVNKDHLVERIHFAMDIVQSFSHEFVYDHHTYIDYDEMRKIVEASIVALFA